MSAARSVRPPCPSLSQAARLADRYSEGESLAALARELGCWRHDLRRRFATLGILRATDELPRRCRVCGEPVRSGTRRDLCAAHVRRYCSRCERPLPRGRQNRWCLLCEGERKPADYALRRELALRRPGTCRHCGAALPPGRYPYDCFDCGVLKRQAERQRQGRRCAGCREPIPPRCAIYCDSCSQVQSAWRRKWHQGDPDARALRSVKRRRYWQGKAAKEDATHHS